MDHQLWTRQNTPLRKACARNLAQAQEMFAIARPPRAKSRRSLHVPHHPLTHARPVSRQRAARSAKFRSSVTSFCSKSASGKGNIRFNPNRRRRLMESRCYCRKLLPIFAARRAFTHPRRSTSTTNRPVDDIRTPAPSSSPAASSPLQLRARYEVHDDTPPPAAAAKATSKSPSHGNPPATRQPLHDRPIHPTKMEKPTDQIPPPTRKRKQSPSWRPLLASEATLRSHRLGRRTHRASRPKITWEIKARHR